MGAKVIILAKSLIPNFLRACAIVHCFDIKTVYCLVVQCDDCFKEENAPAPDCQIGCYEICDRRDIINWIFSRSSTA